MDKCEICAKRKPTEKLPVQDGPDDFSFVPVCSQCWSHYMAKEEVVYYE